MPRLFKPVDGFGDKSLSAISIADDGTSEEVYADGRRRPVGTVNHLKQFVPAWNLLEMSRLIESGKWEEIPAEPANA